MTRLFFFLLVLASALVPCFAAGGVSIFALGTLIDEKHWSVMAMYFVVFGITMLLEFLVHTLHVKVRTRSGTAVVHHITEEVMILGGISAVLVIFENLGGAALIDATLFHYVHFVIFVMAIMFITLVTSLFVTVAPSWYKWVCFEAKVLEIESDPSLSDEDRAAFLMAYIKTVSGGHTKLAVLCYFRQNLPEKFVHVSFCRYMKKMQRKYMLTFLDLKESSWALLGLLCLLAAITDWITISISDNPLAIIGLWVLIVGFGPLLVLVVLSAKVKYEFRDFVTNIQEMRQAGELRPKKPQKRYFWNSSPYTNIMLIQTMLLYQVFYLATVVVNFVYRLWSQASEDDDYVRGVLLILSCFLPSVLVFFGVLPLVLPTFTILASMGEYMDQHILLTMLFQDKKSGKLRRVFNRDKKITLLAETMFVLRRELLLSRQNANIELRNSNVMPVFRHPMDPDDEVVLYPEDYQKKCCECNRATAKVKCNRCGLLCDDCDMSYHRLRLLKNHCRKLFEEPEMPPPKPPIQAGEGATSTKGTKNGKPPLPSKPPPPLDPPPAPAVSRVYVTPRRSPDFPFDLMDNRRVGGAPSTPVFPPSRRGPLRPPSVQVTPLPPAPRKHATPSTGYHTPASPPSRPAPPASPSSSRLQGDWVCPNCGGLNWAAREVCTQCRYSRSVDERCVPPETAKQD